MEKTKVKTHKRNGKTVKSHTRKYKRGKPGKLVSQKVKPSNVLRDMRTGRVFGRSKLRR